MTDAEEPQKKRQKLNDAEVLADPATTDIEVEFAKAGEIEKPLSEEDDDNGDEKAPEIESVEKVIPTTVESQEQNKSPNTVADEHVLSDPSVVIQNGVPIPRDSALLDDQDDAFSMMDIPSDILVKANLNTLKLTIQPSDKLPIRMQFLISSVPLLDNVSTQILRLIGVGPYEETLSIITSEEESPQNLVYKDLVELFEQVKKIFSEDDPFLNMNHFFNNFQSLPLDKETLLSLKSYEAHVDLALKKANLATFLLSTVGSIEVGFFYLNESFLDVFCPVYNDFFKTIGATPEPENLKEKKLTANTKFGKLLKVQAGLFLELKTQAYISALEAGDRSKEDILEDIFPSDLAQQMMNRRRIQQLSPSELDFAVRCKSRRETLLNTTNDEDLAENYDWLIFLKELFSYVSKNITVIIWGKKNRMTVLEPLTNITSVLGAEYQYSGLSKEELKQKLEEQQKKEQELMRQREREEKEKSTKGKYVKEPKSASVKEQQSGTTGTGQTGPPRIRNILRRPWSPTEEAALIDALKELGPYWSKILEFYGAGGSISEALRNRTQVQLKDKARNWKMSYLKNGTPVPDYLAKVTGVIERDDKQANARKRQRQKLEEEKNRLRNTNNAAPALAPVPVPTHIEEKESGEKTGEEASLSAEKNTTPSA